MSVVFAPTGVGAATGSMTISSDASNGPVGVTLQGAGVAAGQLSASPATLNFGSLPHRQ